MFELVRIEEVTFCKGFEVFHPLAFTWYKKGDLEKGRTHKYIKREPYITATGKKKYRYWYQMPGTQKVENRLNVGSVFKHGSGDDASHFHITAVNGDKVTVAHDETGKTVIANLTTLKALLEHNLNPAASPVSTPAASPVSTPAEPLPIEEDKIVTGTITQKKAVKIMDFLHKKKLEEKPLEGDKSDFSDFSLEEAMQVQKYLDIWTGGRYQVVRNPSLFDASLVEEEQGKFFKFKPTLSDFVGARQFFEWATASLRPQKEQQDSGVVRLFRGMKLKPREAESLREGADFDLRMASSFSSDFEVATRFSNLLGKISQMESRRVILEIETKKGVYIGRLSRFESEEETTLGGRVRIVSITRDSEKYGKPHSPAFFVKLEYY